MLLARSEQQIETSSADEKPTEMEFFLAATVLHRVKKLAATNFVDEKSNFDDGEENAATVPTPV